MAASDAFGARAATGVSPGARLAAGPPPELMVPGRPVPAWVVDGRPSPMATDIARPPSRIPTTSPNESRPPARLSVTPKTSRVLQPGHFHVPSGRGRAQTGQLKTCASASPMP